MLARRLEKDTGSFDDACKGDGAAVQGWIVAGKEPDGRRTGGARRRNHGETTRIDASDGEYRHADGTGNGAQTLLAKAVGQSGLRKGRPHGPGNQIVGVC